MFIEKINRKTLLFYALKHYTVEVNFRYFFYRKHTLKHSTLRCASVVKRSRFMDFIGNLAHR